MAHYMAVPPSPRAENKGDKFHREKNMEIQSGGEKMRNASGQQGENEQRWKIKANMNTGNKINIGWTHMTIPPEK